MKKNRLRRMFNPVKTGLLTAALVLYAFAGFATNVTFHLIDHGGNAITDATAIPGWNTGTWHLLSAVDGSGTETISLTPGSYFFNMKYNNYTQQVGPITVTGTALDVTFQTTLVTLQLMDHLGNFITGNNAGTGGYNTGTWYTLGGTGTTGTVSKELLPGTGYYFNMKYSNYTQQKGAMAVTGGGGIQNIPFQTTLVKLHLENHAGAAITDLSGTGGYNTGAWYTIGATDASGVCEMELLPGTGYYFNMNYHNYTQQIGSTSVTTGVAGVQDVTFQTTLVSLNLQHHNGIAPITDGSGTGGYNTGSWHTLGSTDANGTCEVELLPGTGYYFNMNYNNYTQQVGSMSVSGGGGTQNVPFRTTLVSLNLVNHLGAPITDLSGVGGYNTGAWHTLGATNASGACQIELLQGTGYYFNMAYSNQTQQIGAMAVVGSPWTQSVPFQTVLATVNLTDCSSGPSTLINTSAATVQYNTGAWHNFGPAAGAIAGGTVSQELLPGPYYFNMTYNHGYAQQGSLTINAANPTVNFSTTKVTFSGGTVQYNQGTWNPFTITGMNLLPGNYYFSVNGGPNDYTNISGCTKAFNVAPCSGPTGVITATQIATGGSYFLTAPAGGSYLWSNGATTQSIVVGTNGTYSVAVTYNFTCAGTTGGTTTYNYNVAGIAARTVTVRLQDHLGNGLPGATVQYYASSTWTTFSLPSYPASTTDANGNISMTFAAGTSPTSIRVMYNGGTKQWNSVNVATNPVYIDTTTCVSVTLTDHTGALITDGTGIVGYYAGGWVTNSIGATGIYKVELLQGATSFNMNYHTFTLEQASVPISGATQVVNFQTTQVLVNLENCGGTLLTSPAATVDYDGGPAWVMGVPLTNGVSAPIELLQGTYSFAMHYNFGRQQISKPVGLTSPCNIYFNTVNVTISNPNGTAMTYYQTGWEPFTNPMELLPGSYIFHTTATAPNASETVGSSGCTAETLYIQPTGTLAITVNNNGGCGGSFTLTAPANGKSYLWSGPAGFSATTQSIVVSSPGAYSVTTGYDFSPTGVGNPPNVVCSTTISPASAAANTVTLRLVNHLGAGIPGGVVSYYDGSWHTFGSGTTDANGYACHTFPDGSSRIFGIAYAGGFDQFPSTAAAGNPVLVAQTTDVSVVLKDHTGAVLSGGVAQYYTGPWNAIPGGSIELLPGSYPFLMTYNYASEQISYTIGAGPTQEVDFSTTLVDASLQDHNGDGISGGVAQFYSGGWHPLGTTNTNGDATIELLPNSYQFYMTYNNTSEQLGYTIGAGPTQPAPFTTTTVTASLTDHLGNGLDGGVAQYYNGGWYPLGTTEGESGTTPSIELMPGSYQFYMTYNYGSQQLGYSFAAGSYDAAFQTSTVTASLTDHSGSGLSGGTAQYYSGGYHAFANPTDASGNTTVELLPGSYPFLMSYNFGSQQISYTVSGNTSSAPFQTSLVTASLTDHNSVGLSGGTAQFYSGGYHPFATATDGSGNTTVELLPGSYPFLMSYNFGSQQISYTVSGTTSSAPFQTSTVTVSLADHSNTVGAINGDAQFYSGGWHDIGTTSGGIIATELLPGSYPFNMTYNYGTQQVSYPVSGATSSAPFQTALVTIHFQGNTGIAHAGAAIGYYSGGWHSFDNLTDASGNSSMEMLPVSLTYNATLAGYGTTQSPSYYTDASGATPTHIIQSSSAARQAAPGATTVTNTSFGIFPNPATDKITIQYSSVNNAQATVQVTDIAGKVMMAQTFESVTGANAHDLDMSSLPSGMYMIMFSNEGVNETRKINVLH